MTTAHKTVAVFCAGHVIALSVDGISELVESPCKVRGRLLSQLLAARNAPALHQATWVVLANVMQVLCQFLGDLCGTPAMMRSRVMHVCVGYAPQCSCPFERRRALTAQVGQRQWCGKSARRIRDEQVPGTERLQLPLAPRESCTGSDMVDRVQCCTCLCAH